MKLAYSFVAQPEQRTGIAEPDALVVDEDAVAWTRSSRRLVVVVVLSPATVTSQPSSWAWQWRAIVSLAATVGVSLARSSPSYTRAIVRLAVRLAAYVDDVMRIRIALGSGDPARLITCALTSRPQSRSGPMA